MILGIREVEFWERPYGTLDDYDDFPDMITGANFVSPGSSYGVCDSVEQLLDTCPELRSSDRQFFLLMTSVRKAEQPPTGGWRWKGRGPYIGTRIPRCEYLRDEPDIDQVWCFKILEKRVNKP